LKLKDAAIFLIEANLTTEQYLVGAKEKTAHEELVHFFSNVDLA
jgi:hypothetical protein